MYGREGFNVYVGCRLGRMVMLFSRGANFTHNVGSLTEVVRATNVQLENESGKISRTRPLLCANVDEIEE